MTAAATRRWLASEVIQTSMMDCGPAALKCMLDGFRRSASYGRLREACQTDVDGTSIDTLEEIATALGLDAAQVILPRDHLLSPEAHALPAIVVVELTNGLTHFVVVWRRVGGLVQIMDPAIGRRWVKVTRFLDELYLHSASIPVTAFREWACSDEFLGAFRRRMTSIDCARAAEPLIASALADPSWRALAALDAAARMTTSVVESGGLRRGDEAAALLSASFARARANGDGVPEAYWTARPDPEGDDETVRLRGAILVTVGGLRDADEAAPTRSPELEAALTEPTVRPLRELIRLLRAEGWLSPTALFVATTAAVFAVTLESLLFRGLLAVTTKLGRVEHRAAAMAALVLFAAVGLAIEVPVSGGLLRLGRRLETRMRVAFLAKLPRLADRYFHSRPISDMAERGHAVHALRTLPALGGQLVRGGLELAATVTAIAWLDLRSLPLAFAAACAGIAIPLLAQPALAERELRARSHLGALGRSYLDAMVGLLPIRTHGAERAVRREHEGLLVAWSRASYELVALMAGSEALQSLALALIAIALVLGSLERSREPAAILLLLYWTLNLPTIGEELALGIRQWPALRNTTLRIIEPLGALEDGSDDGPLAPSPPAGPGVALTFDGVDVVAGGHTILEGLDLVIPGGQHVAVVGASGAGKSSLVGVLLGWLRPQSGRVIVDGAPLEGPALARLRREIAWVDPTVQIWNRSLFENLTYGVDGEPRAFAEMLEASHLHPILSASGDGLQTHLGDGGALISGGEGQRVRVGRALLRGGVRLAILDEPFRGLDRTRRRVLLDNARAWWKEATLLCVTHDVGETRGFDRVLVVENGRIVEDGDPAALGADPASRYRSMLDAEDALFSTSWRGDGWRRVHLEDGVVRGADRR